MVSTILVVSVYGSLSIDEAAEVLKVSPATVMRDWSTARAWLYRQVAGDAEL
jgi:DNA-directed RNA polymerase specialized sigma24 family protein